MDNGTTTREQELLKAIKVGGIGREASQRVLYLCFLPPAFRPQDEELFRSVPGKIKVMSMAQTAKRGGKKK
jgi:hypothetical protein